jgi:hypothetical protein
MKTPHLESTQLTTNRESSEGVAVARFFESALTEGIEVNVFPLNQSAVLIDSHLQEAEVEGEAKVVINASALPENTDLQEMYKHTLVTVEEVTPDSGLKASELLSLVTAAAIQGHRSFLVKWSLPSPNAVVAAETKLRSKMIEIDKEDKRDSWVQAGQGSKNLLLVSKVKPLSHPSGCQEPRDESKPYYSVGERVYWSKCPAHCEQFAPFEITAIDSDYAKLDLFEKPVLLTELHRSS